MTQVGEMKFGRHRGLELWMGARRGGEAPQSPNVATRLERNWPQFQPGCYGNDILPNCTAVGMANSARAFGTVFSGAAPIVLENLVKAFYARVVGCLPTTQAMEMTTGATEQAALEAGESTGINFGGEGLLVPVGKFSGVTRREIAHVTEKYGSSYLGIGLDQGDLRRSLGEEPWDGPCGPVVERHCCLSWDWNGLGDQDTVRLMTWGVYQKVTWRWLLARMEENWAIGWPQLRYYA